MSVVAKTETVFISVTVLGELLVGAIRSSQPQVNSTRVESFVAACVLLDLDKTTARIYARVKAELWRKGRPISKNDMWVAATALQYELPLYTFDNDLKNVDGLQLFNPLSSI